MTTRPRRICLAANTATSVLSVAIVADDGAVLYRFSTGQTRNQGNVLFSAVGEGLAQNGLSYADIGLLAVVTGPGSFTGIRIGLAAMRGLGLAAGIPVAGVDSFDLFAETPPVGGVNVVAVQSWREELYFRATGADGAVIVPPVNESAADFAARPEIAGWGDILLSGDAAEDLAACLPAARIAESAGDAVRAAQRALRMPETPALPFYLREADISTPKAG